MPKLKKPAAKRQGTRIAPSPEGLEMTIEPAAGEAAGQRETKEALPASPRPLHLTGGRDIIVIGGSAGAVESLIKLVRGLPGNLPAAVFIVLHVPSHLPSLLPALLARAGLLPAAHAKDGERIRQGHIYICPPNCHLQVKKGRIRLGRGPRENGHRPAIDVLFRSAAEAYGSRVAAVVLSGFGSDGTIGLAVVKKRGGAVIVQSAADALHPDMPLSAGENIRADACLPAGAIPALLAELARGAPEDETPWWKASSTQSEAAIQKDNVTIQKDKTDQERGKRTDEPSVLSCPGCGGVLWELEEGGVLQYRCHVGHSYSFAALAQEHSDELESALWRAVRMFREKAMLGRRQVTRARERGLLAILPRFEDEAREAEECAKLIEDLLLKDGASAVPEPADRKAGESPGGGADALPGE